jgi:hypothetical protein
MSETLSDRTRYDVEYRIAQWLRGFERDLRELPPLTPEEAETFLRFVYGEHYDAMVELREAGLYPKSSGDKVIRVTWNSGIHGQGNVTLCINTLDVFPAFRDFANCFWLHQSDWRAKLYDGLPERYQQALDDLERVAQALTEVQKRMVEYTRVRWLLAQWPSAFQIFPQHVRDSLGARRFKRPPPKSVTPISPETLQTLAWLSVIYPLSGHLPP